MKISLCMCVWNTSHLLKRSLETYIKQDFPRNEWELVIVNDNSDDDVWQVVAPYTDVLNIQYVHLNHNYGMRGNTVAFNTAFRLAKGNILAETTPETMFTRDTITQLYKPHLTEERSFIAMKTYNLTMGIQREIDFYNWQKDLMELAYHPEWMDPWVQNNVKTDYFGTHQTCSIKKSVFYELWNSTGFPLYCDYGSDDPSYAGARRHANVKDVTIMQPMIVHQWHPPCQFWMAYGKAPNQNKHCHSTSNFMEDHSLNRHGVQEIPNGGTCEIWDHGDREGLSEEKIKEWKQLARAVRLTGCTCVPND